MFHELFSYAYALRALEASALVGIMCGILGCFIFLRNMALVGDALSHAILPGVVVGFLIAGQSVLAFFAGSVVAGLVAAFLITYIQTNVKSKEDAAIGVVFTTLFSIGVIGISILTRKEGVHLDLKDFLFGNVLAITPQDLWLTSLVAVFVVFSTTTLYRYLFISTFDPTLAKAMGVSTTVIHYFLMLLLSFTVVACLQSVGVILVVGMLIMPASVAYTLTKRLPIMILVSAGIGVLCTVSGFLLAFALDITPGPAMNVVGAIVYIFAIAFAPGTGKLSLWLSRRKAGRLMQVDDLLKAMVNQENQNEPNLLAIQNQLHWSNATWKTTWEMALENGWIQEKSGAWTLTEQGLKRGFDLVGAHRTWEQYLVKNLGYDKSQVHPQAEQLEHFLTPQLLEEIKLEMGNPLKDPHGAYIPQKSDVNQIPLSDLNIGDKALILTTQPTPLVVESLWKEGLSPNFSITILEKTEMNLTVRFRGKNQKIGLILAGQLMVVKIN